MGQCLRKLTQLFPLTHAWIIIVIVQQKNYFVHLHKSNFTREHLELIYVLYMLEINGNLKIRYWGNHGLKNLIFGCIPKKENLL